MRLPERVPLVAALAVMAALAAGCARTPGVPAIRTGAACAGCGMEVHDLRFACERESAGSWRVYDAIECLIRDAGPTAGGGAGGDTAATAAVAQSAWLADYDRQTLHRADSLWVVRGEFPSPMGGGFAAFLAREAADSVAAVTRGRVERLATWLAAPTGGTP